MGLQIWLPLNGNLENKGLANITVAQANTTIDTNGKIGSCYSFNGTNSGFTIYNAPQISNWTESTVCFWIKDAPTGKTQCIINHRSVAGKGLAVFLISDKIRVDTDNSQIIFSDTYNFSEWTHVAIVSKGTERKIYMNGDLLETKIASEVNYTSSGSYASIGASSVNTTAFTGNWLQGLLNDFRLYDEALSPMQIKIISQGLVAHYLLNNNGLGSVNLLKNGFGELGAENWQNASNVFDDVPANHPEIYHSYKKVESSEFIPIYQNHEYKFSTWIKTAATSGNSYPSLCPYDVDKKFIYHYNCTNGFNLATMTTLTQELKKGDTKIYVNDLSEWNANSGHNYNYAALFGYKDSTGYIYPDGVYTRDLGIFGSGTSAKINLDKTNNIITLNSAYTGENKPVGTKVCASTAGTTYFYPLGAISYASITDWVYKEGTFVNNNPRLAVARYVRVYAYDNCYQAGITLTDLTLLSTEDNIEYDVSGYCNNGTKYNITEYDFNSPRYSIATKFNNTDGYINIGRGGMVKDAITVNVWAYVDDWSTFVVEDKIISCTEAGGWNFEVASSTQQLKFVVGTGISSNTYYTAVGLVVSNLTEGWHMFTGTYDGLTVKLYIDGSLNATNNQLTDKTPIHYHKSNPIIIGAESNSSTTGVAGSYFKGSISDVRIYATALSESDIASLYNNSAFVDSSGNVYATEYVES